MPRPRLTNEEYAIAMRAIAAANAPDVNKRLQEIHERTTAKVGLDLPASVLDLPHGHKEVENPFVIDGKRIGVISDVHVPSHDKTATEAAIVFLKSKEIDTLIINGDFMDFYQISRHDKSPLRAITFGDELEEGRVILQQIRDYLGPHVQIIYQEGNHEERFSKFLPQQISGAKVRGASVAEQLDLHRLNITWVGDRRGIQCGKLRIYHGHEINAAGVNAPRAMLAKALDNVLCGHLHREQILVKPRLNGELVGAWVTGALCDKRPHYAPVNEWVHGFATVECEPSGMFSVQLHRIIDGVVR